MCEGIKLFGATGMFDIGEQGTGRGKHERN